MFCARGRAWERSANGFFPAKERGSIGKALFYRSERQPLYKLFLGKPAKHHDRSDRQQGSRRKLRPEKPFWARIGSDKRGQWRRVCTRKVDAPESLVPRKDNQDQRGRRKSR